MKLIGPELRHAVRVEAVDAAVAGGLVDDQTCVLEDLEVLRDSRPADRQTAGELDDGTRAIREPLEDLAPSAIAER